MQMLACAGCCVAPSCVPNTAVRRGESATGLRKNRPKRLFNQHVEQRRISSPRQSSNRPSDAS